MANNLTVSYKGNTIHTASASGSATLNTEGKYMEDDVSLSYTFDGGGSGSAGFSDVNFYDYDGTIVQSYSASDFASLSAMPDNPTHSGLTAQGWNWSLADAKAYVASYGKLNIGQMYVTSDGKTRIYIHLEEGRLAPYLGIAINGTATVDWGDGTTSTVTGSSTSTVVNTQHSYATAGNYVIAIAVSGSMALVGNTSYGSQVLWKNSTTGSLNRAYQNAIQKVEIGFNTSIGSTAFGICYSLASVTIPSGVTSIGDYAFGLCNSLASVTIPSTVTSIGNNAFYSCYSLASVTIPSGVTNIGANAFQNCYSLASVTIPSTVTSISSYAFYSCNSLASVTIPSTVTSIGNNAFGTCHSLSSVVIPSGVTSIDGYAFSTCHSLSSVVIPDSVTSIGGYAFNNCYGLGFIKFTRTTPPTVSNSNAWTNIPTDCIIYVPSGTLSAYTSATNYPSSSTYTYVEY
ncbi:MAG: leucine-rich repeat domain-containing protein [Oscillospiraceae bacterium]|nr:leucine-rich repeat domain-containing protein [Oscillospiraceae bacterium]